MKKTLLVVLCCSMMIIAPLRAQFGIGGATEWTQLANHFELARQLVEMYKLYQQAVQSYKLAVQQAKHVANPGTYKGIWKTWQEMGAPDPFGHNIGFVSNVNGSLGRLGNSLHNLPSWNGMLAKLHPDTMDRIEWQDSEPRLIEGVGAYALDTVGEIKKYDQKANLDQLDGLVFSDGDDVNTQTQEMHKAAMAASIAAHQNEDMKRLLTAIIAQQTMELKSRHDMLEQALTEHQAWLTRAQAGEPESYLGNPSVSIGQFTYGAE